MTDDLTDVLGGIDMNPRKMATKLRKPERIADMLMADTGTGDSAAQVFADVVNVHRADIRRLGMELGVDVEAENMTEQRAADLLAGVVSGDGVELVIVFNEMAAKRDQLLREVLDDDEHSEFMKAKHDMMHTQDPGDFGEGDEYDEVPDDQEE